MSEVQSRIIVEHNRAAAVMVKAATTLIGAVLLIASVGAVYELLGGWRDAHRFRQLGRLVQAGDVRLNINCTGQGRPTVVLDSGFGVPALAWATVQPDVAKFTRVCSYDRAGYGWSDPGPEPRTSKRIATELHNLLTAAGETGPFVMVGHSFGGFNIRLFNHLFPADVAGVVLVDAAAEDEDERVDAILPADIKARRNVTTWASRLNRMWRPIRIRVGVRRLETATGWGIDDSDRHLSRELRQELSYLQHQDKTERTMDGESAAFDASLAQVGAAGTLGDRPLIVLTAGRPYAPDPLLTAESMARKDQLWIMELQAEQSRLSTRGKQIVVRDSSHVIPYDRPDAVIAAVREVWATARGTEDGKRLPRSSQGDK